MQTSFSLIQTVAISGVFSAVSCWYGFMFGRESARKELWFDRRNFLASIY
ncbi:BnaC07g34150D [Brassica napus]|uniref:BnaC07g34150D protein n=2 Tax=Brassica TaxID=3705 RepID=A0A078F8I9_BRANA|nr:uncharacterized protein LOC125590027 [Brassica napus]CDY09646.1 BnaC07g34150D [Brassica napus]VDD39805.1 unnamed protein product [Brassica oleracea]